MGISINVDPQTMQDIQTIGSYMLTVGLKSALLSYPFAVAGNALHNGYHGAGRRIFYNGETMGLTAFGTTLLSVAEFGELAIKCFK